MYDYKNDSTNRCYLDLFLIGFLVLFFELAAIRWFGSTVVFLTFFTNVVLLATFLGTSAGCLAAKSRFNWIQTVVPILLLAVALGTGVLWTYEHFGKIMVDVGGQGSPQQVYFGTEYRARDLSNFVVPIEFLAGVFFVVIAFVCIGIGQEMGRAFAVANDRLVGYICNVSGSLIGIAAFALASDLRTTPLIWFATIIGFVAYFVRSWTYLQITSTITIFVLLGISGANITAFSRERTLEHVEMWSPYYKIVYTPKTKLIENNNIGHQELQSIATGGEAYSLPYLLNRDARGKTFDDVLIIGAGSGNDVQAALANGAKHVDAVEIDPAVYEIGYAEHPDHPYEDSRVTIHINDGRSFLRSTNRRYDLIVYALVDSLMLHSGYSSLRLESFLFTQEAFDDVASRLKEGGIFVAYNFFRWGWIVGRLDKMAQKTFGHEPMVISLPYVDSIHPDDQETNKITLLLASPDDSEIEPIRRRFKQQAFFWINRQPSVNLGLNGFGFEPPAPHGSPLVDWDKVAPAVVYTSGIALIPSDDWPFLYLRERAITSLNARNIALIAVLSIAIIFASSPAELVLPNWQFFFLGAGFMLLETRSIIQMALLFGSTWQVNSIVLFAILVMVLASNVYLLRVNLSRLWLIYCLLFAAVILNFIIPVRIFLSLPNWQKAATFSVVTFMPIFFAGIIFGALFRQSYQPNVDFGSNIAGAIVGGLSESIALMAGFKYLLGVAVAFYLISATLGRHQRIPKGPFNV